MTAKLSALIGLVSYLTGGGIVLPELFVSKTVRDCKLEVGMNLPDIDKNVAKDSAKLLHWMKKQSKEKTPLPLKIFVVIDVWIVLGLFQSLLSPTSQHSLHAGLIVNAIVGTTLSIVALIGIWNLRKWGVYLLAGLTLLKVAGVVWGVTSVRVIVIFCLFQFVILGPPIMYWKKMH